MGALAALKLQGGTLNGAANWRWCERDENWNYENGKTAEKEGRGRERMLIGPTLGQTSKLVNGAI